MTSLPWSARSAAFFVFCSVFPLTSCSADDPAEQSVHTGGYPGTGGEGLGTGGEGLGTGGVPLTTGGTSGTGGTLPSTGGVGSGGSSSGGSPTGGASGTGGASSETGGSTGTGGASGGGDPGTGGSNSTALFATDFEAEAVGDVMTGGATWTTTLPTEYDSMGVVAVVEDGDAHSGSKSVYVKKGGDGQAFLQLADASVFPFSGSVLFVRAWIKLPSWPTDHASWIEVGAATNEVSEIRLGENGGALQVNHWPKDQDQIADGVSMMPNTWYCLEMSYEPGTKTIQVWLDDAPVPALTVMGSFERGGAFDPAPPIEAIRFGAEIAGTEAWYDDIAVGTEKLGCD